MKEILYCTYMPNFKSTQKEEDSKESACGVRDQGSIPGSGRSPGEGNGDPLQYSCLENPMGGGVWQATVHGVAKSQTRLSDFTSLTPCPRYLETTCNPHI